MQQYSLKRRPFFATRFSLASNLILTSGLYDSNEDFAEYLSNIEKAVEFIGPATATLPAPWTKFLFYGIPTYMDLEIIRRDTEAFIPGRALGQTPHWLANDENRDQDPKGGASAISASGHQLNHHSPSNLQLDISQSLPIIPSSKSSPLDPPIEPLKTILSISKIPTSLPRPIFRILSLNCAKNTQTTSFVIQLAVKSTENVILCFQEPGFEAKGEPPHHPLVTCYSSGK
jgi:hypothetical protein